MSYIKKTIVTLFISTLLGGGIWYLNITNGIDGISSSVLDFSTFNCTETSLQSHDSMYRKVIQRNKKVIVIKRNLDKEIELLKTSDPKNELQKKEKTSRMLSRYISRNNGFMRKYETCKKEIKFNPHISIGLMSGEARVAVSEKEYQALVAFAISSPTGLNTYIQSIRFKVDTLPDVGMVADKWFLLHEGSNPIMCQISSNVDVIDCDLSGDMPVDVLSGMTRNYGLGAHITDIQGVGTVNIQIAQISFNESRTNTDTEIQSPLLSFGAVAPVVVEVGVPTVITIPPLSASDTTATIPLLTTPVILPIATETSPTQAIITPPNSSEITLPENGDVSVPVVPPSSESGVPTSSENIPPANGDSIVPPSSESSEETLPLTSSETV